MTRFDTPSRCSAASQLSFRWYGYPPCSVTSNNVDAAVDVLMGAISGPGRVWNPWTLTMARREFRSRILKASQGQLVPVDEVKPVDVANPPPMYEIRWQDLNVTERDADGSQQFKRVAVRMYHSEPQELSTHFIGHHAHEKEVDVSDVNAAQNAEIATAVGWYRQGHNSLWGIAR